MSNDVLIRPLVTEKLTRLMEEGQYTFEVAKSANKIEIRNAIEARYPGVKIDSVRTLVVRGKRRRQMTRRGVIEGRKAFHKRAIVSLKEGSEPIDFFESV
ncbi:MAG: 50S ribosomal protein L23 [Rhodothermales bacterium]